MTLHAAVDQHGPHAGLKEAELLLGWFVGRRLPCAEQRTADQQAQA
jgi:hypothetical protein